MTGRVGSPWPHPATLSIAARSVRSVHESGANVEQNRILNGCQVPLPWVASSCHLPVVPRHVTGGISFDEESSCHGGCISVPRQRWNPTSLLSPGRSVGYRLPPSGHGRMYTFSGFSGQEDLLYYIVLYTVPGAIGTGGLLMAAGITWRSAVFLTMCQVGVPMRRSSRVLQPIDERFALLCCRH